MPRVTGRPGASLAPLDFDKLTSDLQEKHPHISNKDVMSAALYPSVTEDFLNFREQYGPVDKIDTRIFLVGPKVGEEFEVSSLLTCTASASSCPVFLNPYREFRRWSTFLRSSCRKKSSSNQLTPLKILFP